jgi:hypothetical protein
MKTFRIRANLTFQTDDLTNAYLALSDYFYGLHMNNPNLNFKGECQVKEEETKEVDDKFKRKYEDVAITFGNTFVGKMVAEVPDWYLDKCLLEQDWVEKKYPKVYAVAKQERAYRDKWHIKVTE